MYAWHPYLQCGKASGCGCGCSGSGPRLAEGRKSGSYRRLSLGWVRLGDTQALSPVLGLRSQTVGIWRPLPGRKDSLDSQPSLQSVTLDHRAMDTLGFGL